VALCVIYSEAKRGKGVWKENEFSRAVIRGKRGELLRGLENQG